jgi:hypothetical protein
MKKILLAAAVLAAQCFFAGRAAAELPSALEISAGDLAAAVSAGESARAGELLSALFSGGARGAEAVPVHFSAPAAPAAAKAVEVQTREDYGEAVPLPPVYEEVESGPFWPTFAAGLLGLLIAAALLLLFPAALLLLA